MRSNFQTLVFKMKVLYLFIVILSCALAGSASEKWQQFQRDFGKSYKSPVEARARYAIFEKNLKDIEEHNVRYENGEVSWKQGINQFSDWTSEEFMEYVNKFKYNKNDKLPVAASRLGENLGIPESIDWRTEGAVSPVKDQAQCGGCWAFSATGAIEGQFKLVKNVTVSLSEQNLIDCASFMTGDYSSFGCFGGQMEDGFKYAMDKGIASEEDYPFEMQNDECRPKTNVYKIDNFVSVPKSEKELQIAVGLIGPISVGIQATANLQNYAGGVIYDEACDDQLNHGVLAVGYGSDNGDDYWLVKNSWGPKWGEDGYFKLARKNNNCGITNMANYAVIYE